MIFYLSAENVIDQLTLRSWSPKVRDRGLLESAIARPQATAGGEDAYATLHEKAAALLHSPAKNHAFVDGNKRAALLGAKAMLDINGWEFLATDAEAYNLILSVADGTISELSKITELLLKYSRRRTFSNEPLNLGGDDE